MCATALICITSATLGQGFERTEEREDCARNDPLRVPLFGDLHVHTSYSFDSWTSSQRNDPWNAYRYAKGEAIQLSDPDGDQSVTAQLRRPLDFTGLTDHAEFLGPINLCTRDKDKLAYWYPFCMLTRTNTFMLQFLALDYWQRVGVTGGKPGAQRDKSFICTLGDCDEAHKESWQLIQQAAEDHYDRSSDCSFTTFVGYEYTDAPNYNNLHRNVIFRNARVTETAISTYDTGTMNFPELWRRLRKECIDGDEGCDVMAIPHNPNLSGGMMFPDPASPEEAQDRAFFEPLVELVQHKAASECRYDRLAGLGVDTEDELCDFEQVVGDNLSMLGTVFGEVRTKNAAPVPIADYGRRNMVRNVLKDGLALGQRDGLNPFQLGFIGSTDTHSATPGGTEEDNYTGHLGRRDTGYRNIQDHFFDNPGGLAVVWAEENSRDAIFEAMRRRETYATSGTRPIVRLFAGADLQDDMCSGPEVIAEADRLGVPMGGELAGLAEGEAMRLLVSAMKDSGSPGLPGNDLQRVQVIKGWVDHEGNTHEKVYDVAGSPDNGAWVNPQSCAPTGSGHQSLCAVWEDPDFDRGEDAFYYVRVLENPSCRWSTLQCQALGVNPFAENCQAQADIRNEELKDDGAIGNIFNRCCLDPKDEPFYSPVIQERAWTSPIWYQGVQAAR